MEDEFMNEWWINLSRGDWNWNDTWLAAGVIMQTKTSIEKQIDVNN